MKSLKLATIAAIALLGSTSFAVNADTISGKIVGHSCAHSKKSCPIDNMDPHIALERDFVLVMPNGKYVFLTNVPRDVKVRHALEQVTITGQSSKRYNSIVVDEIKQNNTTLWSQEAAIQEYEDQSV